MYTDRKFTHNSHISLAGIITPSEKYGVIAIPHAIRMKPYEKGDKAHFVAAWQYPNKIGIPKRLLDIAGFAALDTIRLFCEDGEVILYDREFAKTFDGNKSVFLPAATDRYLFREVSEDFREKAAKADVSITRIIDNNILLTSLKDIGADPGENIAVTFFYTDNGVWLEVEKATEDAANLVTRQELSSFVMTSSNKFLSGLTYLDKLNGNRIYIPKFFSSRMKLEGGLPVWTDAKCKKIVVEAPVARCTLCDAMARTTLSHKTGPICPECLEKMKDAKPMLERLEKAKKTSKKSPKKTL